MGVVLLECREDKERKANFPSKETFQSTLETMASFTDGTIITEM